MQLVTFLLRAIKIPWTSYNIIFYIGIASSRLSCNYLSQLNGISNQVEKFFFINKQAGYEVSNCYAFFS